MALYFLTYDLRTSQDYQVLYDELKKLDALKILDSTWCFNCGISTDVEFLRDHFKSFIDENDALVVSEVPNWASYYTDSTPDKLRIS
jgi:hypothetical protein